MRGPIIGAIVAALLVSAAVALGWIKVGTAAHPIANSRQVTLVSALVGPGSVDEGTSGTSGNSASARALIIPVVGVRPDQLTDSWGQTREAGLRAHEAIDIPAPSGTPVVAAMSGRIEKLFTSLRGGLTIYQRADDGVWQAYYAHLSGYTAGLAEGQRIGRGAVIGYVGESGNVSPGSSHLHFALARMAPGDHWSQGAPVNPYPLLVGSSSRR